MGKKFALMTEEEIRCNYNQAADKKKQIGILAELNLCSKGDIERVVLDGMDVLPVHQRKPRKLVPAETQEKIAREHLEDGVPVKDLAVKYDLTTTSVLNYVKKYRVRQYAESHPIAAPQPMPETDEEVAVIRKTLDALYDAGRAKIEQVEQESADYTQFSITKLRDGIVCIIEKDGIRVEIEKRTTTDREEVQV